MRERFEPYEDYVDASNATDNTAAHAHASPLAVAIALKQLGMEPVMQLVCRDRNRLALQAEIAGAALHGIENICCLTGDDVTAGDEPEARRVFDLDSIQLLAHRATRCARGTLPLRPRDRPRAAALPRRGREPGRAAVRLPRRARAQEGAGRRALPAAPGRLRAASGSSAFMAEAVETGLAEQCARSCRRSASSRSPARCASSTSTCPGISVPAETIERCERAADPEAECFEVACELAEHARSLPGVAGLHLISFRREAGIARLCRRLGIPTRDEREMSGYRRPVAV